MINRLAIVVGLAAWLAAAGMWGEHYDPFGIVADVSNGNQTTTLGWVFAVTMYGIQAPLVAFLVVAVSTLVANWVFYGTVTANRTPGPVVGMAAILSFGLLLGWASIVTARELQAGPRVCPGHSWENGPCPYWEDE